MDYNTDSDVQQEDGEPLSKLLTLPIKVVVYIILFIDTRDRVKLRYVSRRLRSVCEIPSLWREFIWPYLGVHEKHCVKSVLKSCGRFIEQLSFPNHVMPSMSALRYCTNLVELSLPKTELSPDELEMAIEPMEKLQSLCIPWTYDEIYPVFVICSRLKELTITQNMISYESTITEWEKYGFIPEKLNIIELGYVSRLDLLKLWLQLNPSSPTNHVGYFKVYRRFKLPLNLLPLPHFQLQFGQSCTLPLVQASEYGLFIEDILLLTNCTYGSRALNKATVVLKSWQDSISQSNNNSGSLTNLTHFNASCCQLHSGQLEHLAMACPNLLELNLQNNANCLKNLQGLRTIADCCKNLRGLNLLSIAVEDVENHVQFWEILMELKLTYLGIDWCVLLPYDMDRHVKESVINFHHKCSDLKALEVENHCDQCKDRDFVLLSNFSSLVHLHANTSRYPTAVEDIVSSCKMLKYFINRSERFIPSGIHCNLKQLAIHSRSVDIPETFMESVSAHSGLVHVVLEVKSVTGDGVSALVRNSPDLMTCHLCAYPFYARPGVPLRLKQLEMTLRKTFYNRKLFSCGIFHLSSSNLLAEYQINDNTQLTSIWYERSDK